MLSSKKKASNWIPKVESTFGSDALEHSRCAYERVTGLEPSAGKTFDQQVVYTGDPMLKLLRNLFVLRQAWKMIKRRR